jgi:hypothetical protein
VLRQSIFLSGVTSGGFRIIVQDAVFTTEISIDDSASVVASALNTAAA